jgi:hypothetical protein
VPHRAELTGTSSAASGLDFFAGGPEYFKIIPLTWQDNEFMPVLQILVLSLDARDLKAFLRKIRAQKERQYE